MLGPCFEYKLLHLESRDPVSCHHSCHTIAQDFVQTKPAHLLWSVGNLEASPSMRADKGIFWTFTFPSGGNSYTI